jgi:hypothetical protein
MQDNWEDDLLQLRGNCCDGPAAEAGRGLAPGWPEQLWQQALERHGHPATIRELPWNTIIAEVLGEVPPVPGQHPTLPSAAAVRGVLDEAGLGGEITGRSAAAEVGVRVLDILVTAQAVRFAVVDRTTSLMPTDIRPMCRVYSGLGSAGKELLPAAAALWTLLGSWRRVACMAHWLYMENHHWEYPTWSRWAPARTPPPYPCGVQWPGSLWPDKE